jgi:hypothetical protein
VGLVVALLLPGLALASVGKIAALEGTAIRMDGSGQEHALAVGSEIELKDTLKVGKASNLKLRLTDESVMMLGADSQLYIDEATFEGQERKGFSAKLLFGKVWAKVKQMAAGSEAKFEVTTERAVAGVRGTIFRVDYVNTVEAATPTSRPNMVVRVVKGRVDVLVPRTGPQPPPPNASPPKRTQVAPPQQVPVEQWMEMFARLQAGQETEVGDLELGEPGAPQSKVVRRLDKKAMKDDFGQFVDRNQ